MLPCFRREISGLVNGLFSDWDANGHRLREPEGENAAPGHGTGRWTTSHWQPSCSPWSLSEEPPLGGAHGGGERPGGWPLSGCAELVEGGDPLGTVIRFAVGITGVSGPPNRILSFRWVFPLPGAARLGLTPGAPPSAGP